jgi:flagellar hook-associated protein 1 FlgK
MSLTVSLQSALASLQATQAALQVTSNNVANVNSDGYTRKTVTTQTQIVSGRASGVRLGDIERNVDENLLRQVRDQMALTGRHEVRDAFFQRTQELFGAPGSDADISHLMANMAAAIESLATSPENVASRYDMISIAVQMTNQFRTLSGEIQEMRADADREISDTVAAINTQLASIDDLNRQIARAVGQGLATADLKDVRDQALGELGKLIEVQSFERSDGQVIVFTSSGRPLVDNGYVTLSHTAGAQFSASLAYPSGIAGITYGTGGPDITTEFTGGKIAGLVALRDRELVDLQAEIDRLAESTSNALNAAHNSGSAYPPPASLTGTRSFAANDTPFWSGTFRVTIADSNGDAVENLDINLGGLITVNQLASAINAMTNASASVNASGKLEITASSGNGVVVSDLSSSIVNGNQTVGVSQFFGLNDLLTGPTNYNSNTSDRVASATTALGIAGTLSVSPGLATLAVAYVAGDSLTDIAAKINTAAGVQNVVAAVVNDGTGYRLTITDTDGDNVLLSDTGALTSTINLRNANPGLSGIVDVRTSLQINPNLVSSARASSATTIAAGDAVLSLGDSSALEAMAAAFNQDLTMTSAGGLPTTTARLADYAGRIVARNATQASNASTDLRISSGYAQALETQAASLSEVNIDEEMAQIMILQNAYQASARITTTISEMMDTLLSIGA